MNMAYRAGYLTALTKLGMKATRKVPDPTPTETQERLDTADEHTPAGGFAQALTQMEEPNYASRKRQTAPKDTTESRLNRDVQWSNPQDIPDDYMTGATTMIPGGGF